MPKQFVYLMLLLVLLISDYCLFLLHPLGCFPRARYKYSTVIIPMALHTDFRSVSPIQLQLFLNFYGNIFHGFIKENLLMKCFLKYFYIHFLQITLLSILLICHIYYKPYIKQKCKEERNRCSNIFPYTQRPFCAISVWPPTSGPKINLFQLICLIEFNYNSVTLCAYRVSIPFYHDTGKIGVDGARKCVR